MSSIDELKGRLFAAAQAGEHQQLEALCRANRQAVIDHFPAWQKVPDEVRKDPALIQGYVQAMLAIAELFAQRLGTPELLDRLTGNGRSNPLLRWQNALQQTQQLMTEQRYGEARDLLANTLIDAHGLQGSGVDAYLAVTLGRLGECCFQAGDADRAIPHLEEALRQCQRTGDGEGVIAYLGNLYEVHRYRGQADLAAEYAERLAGTLDADGRSADAAHYRRQARIVRAGEPLNRVVAVIDGVRHELDEVGRLEGKRVQFIFERNRVTLRPSQAHTRRGEQLGNAGRYDEALDAFREAAAADRHDPHPRFLEGFTLLHLERHADAVESYETAESLAPGWFHCRSDLWLARQLALGRYGQEVFQGLHVLEDGSQSAAEKLRLAEQMLPRVPDLAPLHLLHGKVLSQLGRHEEARAACRRGLACADEPDVKTRLLVDLGAMEESPEERARLMREAHALNGNLVAGAMAYLSLKAMAEQD